MRYTVLLSKAFVHRPDVHVAVGQFDSVSAAEAWAEESLVHKLPDRVEWAVVSLVESRSDPSDRAIEELQRLRGLV